MNGEPLSGLMVIALGSLGGTILGIAIGYAAGKQKSEWPVMTRREKLFTLSLVISCSAICIAVLAWYARL